MAQKQKPAKNIRLGRIRASIWANSTESGDTWFNVSVTRLYRDGDRWQDTTTFGRDDLPVVSKVVDMAYAWIWDQDRSAIPVSAGE